MLVGCSLIILFEGFIAFSVVGVFQVKFKAIPLDDFGFLIALMLPVAFNLIFVTTLLNVTWRLETIDEFLGAQMNRRELKTILRIYSKFDGTVSHVNRYFTFNTMICFLDVLMIALMVVFLAYDIVVHSLMIKDVILMLSGISYVLVSGFSCVMVIVYSSKISSLKNSSFWKMNGMRLKSHRETGKRCELGILQISSSVSQVSCGLFTFDSYHIFTIISSLFSYLVVVIQFDIMIQNN